MLTQAYIMRLLAYSINIGRLNVRFEVSKYSTAELISTSEVDCYRFHCHIVQAVLMNIAKSCCVQSHLRHRIAQPGFNASKCAK